MQATTHYTRARLSLWVSDRQQMSEQLRHLHLRITHHTTNTTHTSTTSSSQRRQATTITHCARGSSWVTACRLIQGTRAVAAPCSHICQTRGPCCKPINRSVAASNARTTAGFVSSTAGLNGVKTCRVEWCQNHCRWSRPGVTCQPPGHCQPQNHPGFVPQCRKTLLDSQTPCFHHNLIRRPTHPLSPPCCCSCQQGPPASRTTCTSCCGPAVASQSDKGGQELLQLPAPLSPGHHKSAAVFCQLLPPRARGAPAAAAAAAVALNSCRCTQ